MMQTDVQGGVQVAGAPISWGVCEVPGWGLQLPPERVLAEMRELGLVATEFGPEGFLPADPRGRSAALARHEMTAVGGFFPAVLHDANADPLPAVNQELAAYRAAGAEVLVLAAATGLDGYDTAKPALGDAEWRVLNANLDRIAEAAQAAGVTAVLHPHVGTMVENSTEISRVLDGSRIGLCLDTGHLLIGGTDPVAFAAAYADRVAHVHLKDVHAPTAERVRGGRAAYRDAVASGLYRPLGGGDIDIARIVQLLRAAGYQGWLVLEQDHVLTAAPPPGSGPAGDARRSIEFLRGVLAEEPVR